MNSVLPSLRAVCVSLLASLSLLVGLSSHALGQAERAFGETEEPTVALSKSESAVLAKIDKCERTRKYSKELLTFLKSDRSKLRAAAALCIARLREDSAVWALKSALLVEQSKLVKRNILFALGQIKGGELVLASWLSRSDAFKSVTPDPHLLGLGTRAFSKCAKAKQHVPLLVNLLNHRLTEVRRSSAIAFALMRRRREKMPDSVADLVVSALLRRCLVEKNSEVKSALSYALASISYLKLTGHKQIIAFQKALQLLLSDSESTITRAFAARAFGARAKEVRTVDKSGPLQAPDFICPKINWPWPVAVEAIRALEHFAGDKVIQVLLKLADKHESFHVRRIAIHRLRERLKSLDESQRTDFVKVLQLRIDDLWDTVRGEALLALTAIQQDQVVTKIESFATSSVMARVYAAKSLASLPKLDIEQPLLQLLFKDQEAIVRLSLIEALSERNDQVAVLVASKALSDRSTSVAGAAISFLAEKPSKIFVEQLKIIYFRSLNNSRSYELRELIVKTLGDLHAKATKTQRSSLRNVLVSALQDPRQSVRIAAADAIEKFSNKRPSFVSIEPPKAPSFKKLKVKDPWLQIKTTRGTLYCELFQSVAPIHVANVCHLVNSKRADGRRFYEGLSWHRVVSHFVVQGGCPNGDGWGDPGWTIIDELSDLRFSRGTLGMPKAGPDTGGCQLFFCHDQAPHLDGQYTIFGAIRFGLHCLDQLEEGDRILTIEVIDRQTVANLFPEQLEKGPYHGEH